MSRPARRLRGQPLAAFSLLLGLWVVARVVTWEPLLADRVEAASRPAGAVAHHSQIPAARVPAPVTVPISVGLSANRGPTVWTRHGATLAPAASVPVFVPRLDEPLPVAGADRAPLGQPPVQPLVQSPVTPLPKAQPGLLSPRIAAAHQMAWLAGIAQLPLPPEAAAALARRAGGVPLPAGPVAHGAPRWSADGWLLLRQGGGAGASPGGALLPALGASQVGAVVRYRLAPDSAHRPALYLRASSALHQPRGEELAAGIALRPLPRLPVAAMAEARLTQTGAGLRLRPAAALVTELPPVELPGGLRGEAYVQAGYVGGAGATAFVDGQARIEAPLASIGQFRLRAGAGAWGGAQKGANRLDVGPTATIAVPLGSGGGRLSADWRFRVAGNAAPTSGPALTLSAGF